MSDIILYGDPRSTYLRTARMAAMEKDISHELQAADLSSEAYTDLHPFKKMPSIRHGDFDALRNQRHLSLH